MSGREPDAHAAPRRRAAPELAILHVDDDIVVIDKPAGLLSVPGRGAAPSAATVLRASERLRDNPAVRVVHRLDREASGVLLFARTLAAQQALVRQFAAREARKVYVAIVGGYVVSEGEVSRPLVYDRRLQRVRVAESRGKPSLTRYRVIKRLPGNTVLECLPVTGRQHQIRAHLASIGHPLTVDALYGGGQAVLLSHYKSDYRPSKRHEERPLIDRVTLHALRLTIAHPRSGAEMTFEAPLPKDFRATLSQLERLLVRRR